MPIRRPRGPKPALKHVAFLEAMDRMPEGDAARKPMEAAFLTLRVLDQWMWLGTDVSDPTSQVLTAAKTAVQTATKEDAEVASALNGILEAIVLLHEPDAQPVLPRVFALGGLYEQRGATALAGDVYSSVVKYVDSRAHFDLAYDALMRQAFCLRIEGVFDHAQRSYEAAGALAARARDRSRVLHSRIGEAKVQWNKGNLPAADAGLTEVVSELTALKDERVLPIALHDLACVARARDDVPRALRLAVDAFRRSTNEVEKERVLADIALLLSLTGAYETARAALTVIESGTRVQESRWFARMNLMDLGARQGSEPLFEQYRRSLENESLPPRHLAGYLRDAGKGFATFGNFDAAESTLKKGLDVAARHGLHQYSFDIDAALKDLQQVRTERAKSRLPAVSAPPDIEALIADLTRNASVATVS